MTQEQLTGPRITLLQSALASGDHAALDRFWQEVAVQGTPLIEPVADDNSNIPHMLVTFLWRGDEHTRNVVVVSALAGTYHSPRIAKNQMQHLPDTDLWYKTYLVPADARATYWLSPNDALLEPEDVEDWSTRTATYQLDPLNPHHFVLSADEEGGDDEETLSFVALPSAPSQHWTLPHEGVPTGNLTLHRVRSAILKNERRVWVYTPPGYDTEHEPYPVIVLFDGFAYTGDIPTPVILDNLIAAQAIPPVIAVMVCSLTYEDRERELSCYPPFVDFLAAELLPYIRQRYNCTADPASTAVGGSSYGGLAAIYAAIQRSDVFGNVLSQSGSVYWTPEGDSDFEWLTRQFVTQEQLPIRFYLEVGLMENNQRLSDCPTGPTQLAANRHLRNILQAKGYNLHYAEFNGDHSYLNWRGTLANGLIALFHQEE